MPLFKINGMKHVQCLTDNFRNLMAGLDWGLNNKRKIVFNNFNCFISEFR